jgi:O-antigen/teichoic acid export membrane protein
MILARVLTPEDFGQLAVVTLTIFAGMMLTEVSLESALIQRHELPSSFLHTAWTLMVLRGTMLFFFIQLTAPWIAQIFDHPQVEALLRIGAVSFLLVSLSTVSMALLLREMRYRSRVLLDSSREIVGGGCAIILALLFENAWALLLGLLVGQAVTLIGSWIVHPYRPRVLLDRVATSHFWKFGRHLYVSGVLTYVVTRGADLTVGKIIGLGGLGHYQMVFGIAEILTRGLSGTVGQVVLPAYTYLTAQGRSVVEAFEEVWRMLLYLLLPITAVLSIFHTQVVMLILGEQWIPSALTLAILVVGQALRALAGSCGTLILSAGKTQYLSTIKVAEAVCFILLIVPLVKFWGIAGAASCFAIVYGVSLLGHLYAAQQIAPVIFRILQRTGEPLAVTLAGAAFVWQLDLEGMMNAYICILLWFGAWVGYVWVRQASLLRKIWGAIPGFLPQNPGLKIG